MQHWFEMSVHGGPEAQIQPAVDDVEAEVQHRPKASTSTSDFMRDQVQVQKVVGEDDIRIDLERTLTRPEPSYP